MKLWQKDKNTDIIYSNNRINIIIAIVFLLGMVILYKLYDVQINKYDLYSALASSQHSVSAQLQPSRGRIFMSDYVKNQNGENLYPFATNKDFALVFAIPQEVTRPEETAEKLYLVFDKEKIEKEVAELLAEWKEKKLGEELTFLTNLDLPAEQKAAKEAEVRQRYANFENTELYETKKEAEINSRRDETINKYLAALTKPDDPYEPLQKKVDEDTLKSLYSQLAELEGRKILPAELDMKEGKIIIKNSQEELKLTGISHSMVTYRFYPENEIGAHILGFVTQSDEEQRGKYGLEGFFDQELFGEYGSIKTERGADRQIIIVNDREYVKPVDGSDLVLTIDRSVQFTVCQKLKTAVEKYGADSGNIIVMEPKSGAIIAMCSWPDFDPNNYQEVEDIKIYNNPIIFEQYEPGSVFKTITMAAALDQGKITPETTYNDEGQVMISGWPKPIKNSDYATYGGHGEVNMNTVLEESLNTGAIFAMQQIGPDVFAQYVKKFGFGEKTGIELETESPGDIKNLSGDNIHEIYAATASFGQGITVTPLQMITAYAAVANGGILMQPYLVKEIIPSDGSRETVTPKQIGRVISEKAATLLTGMLVNVVESGHAKLAAVEGYWVAGKTGTAQVASQAARGYSAATTQTFIGFAPAEEPKFVMLIKLDNPKNVSFAASSSAPLFGEIAEFLLQYYQVPEERD